MSLPPGYEATEDQTVIGEQTRELIGPGSQALASQGLLLVGITWAKAPYKVIRRNLPDGHIVATVEGEGELWQGGKWCRCREGDIFINPPNSPEFFHPARGKRWVFCWAHTVPAFFDSYPERSPRLVHADPRLFHLAVEGYLHCSRSGNHRLEPQAWAHLVRTHGLDLLHSAHAEVRLWKLWEAVTKDLAQPWDVHSLARAAGLSREQLRHHSHRETGRAPMQQVAWLRIQRALEIVQTSNYKLDAIAELVGYSSGFALSNACLKLTGQRPSKASLRTLHGMEM